MTDLGTQVLLYSICLGLAGIIGYAIRKASTCAVGAVAEVIERKRYRRFLSFLFCSAVVTAVLAPLVWVGGGGPDVFPTYGANWSSVLGGVLFGLGAVINGACNFGTIDRLGCGEVRYLLLFPGLFVGAIIGAELPVLPAPPTGSYIAQISPLALGWVGAALILIVSFTRTSIQHKKERGTPGQPVVFYMGIIGGLTAIIVWILGPWHYTRISVLGAGLWSETTGQRILILAGLLVSVIVGAVAAGIRDGRFRLRMPTLGDAATTLLGGVLMGAAIMLIPGGNDGIVLSGIPSLSPSAIVAYLSMCVTIGLAVWLPNQFKPPKQNGPARGVGARR